MATDAQAIAAGFKLPLDGDLIRDGDDAIRHNARTALDLISDAAWSKGAPATTVNLDRLTFGQHEIRSGAVSEALGLPGGLTGSLEKMPVDSKAGTAVLRWFPRSRTPETWQKVRQSDGSWTSWTLNSPLEIRPDAFGDIGAGDDRPAMQAWLNYLAANGGTGVLDARTYAISAPLVLDSPARSFEVRGAGRRQTMILMNSATLLTPLSITNPVGVTIRDFTIGGASAARLASHGFSFSNPVECLAERIRVVNYQNSAGLFFRRDETEVAEGNHMRDCLALGGGVANNGFLIESCRKSSIDDSWVYALNKDGSPSYGLQMKNSCQDSHIRGGGVRGAKAGVAFGSDTSGTKNTRATVSDVVVSDVTYGFIGSNTTDSHVSLLVDYAGQPVGAGYPVRIGAGMTGVTIDATVRNVPAGQTVAYVGSSGNTVKLAPLAEAPAYLVELVPLLVNTTVIYDGPEDHLKVLDRAGSATNAVMALRGMNDARVTVENSAVGRRAFAWDKGNSRRQLIYGDTGARLVTATLANGKAINMTIRRVGSRVEVSLRQWTNTDGKAPIYVFPPGFVPAQTPLVGFIGYSEAPFEIAALQIVAGVLTQITTHADSVSAQFDFTTNDPWPAELPGTAIGTPN